MSLKIRRGTDAERLTITPSEGELIYTTDTKELYIGDGFTVGGNIVTSEGAGGGGGGNGYTGSIGATGYTGSASTVVGYTGSGATGYTGSVPSGPAGYVGSFKGSLYAWNGDIMVNASTKDFNVKGNVNVLGPLNGIIISTEGSEDDNYTLFGITSATEVINGTGISALRTRGTLNSKKTALAGDTILSTYYAAYTSSVRTDTAVSVSVIASIDPNGTVSAKKAPGLYTISTADNLGNLNVNLSIDKDGLIGLSNNTLIAGGGSGQVDSSSVVTYLKIKVGGTNYALPLYAIRP